MATSQDCGTYPADEDKLIISSGKVLTQGKAFLNSLVATGSIREEDD